MLVLFSHLLAFSTLFIGAVWDLYTTDVPDFLGVAGVLGGIGLHAAASYSTGSIDPLLWSLSAGTALSIYGWGAYLLGMWGGADAFAMSVLGFAAPYGLSGPGALHLANLFVNTMLAGFVYSVFFAFYRAYRSDTVFEKTLERLRSSEKRISMEILFTGVVSGFAELAGLNGGVYFLALISLILMYRFLKVLEVEEMSFERSVSELEPGDVVSLDMDIGVRDKRVRDKNFVGSGLEILREKTESVGAGFVSSRLSSLEVRVGYPEVVGITEEEIEALREQGVEEVEVRTGARFVPVFPVALLLTDVFGGGIVWLVQVF